MEVPDSGFNLEIQLLLLRKSRERVFDDWSLDGLDISIELHKNLLSYEKFILGGHLDFVRHFVFCSIFFLP
jgi:hypothetical protein